MIQRLTKQQQVAESEAGLLLADLERRQDDVLAQLDELDKRLCGILKNLGVTPADEEQHEFENRYADDAGEEANPISVPQFRPRRQPDFEIEECAGGFSKPPRERLDGLAEADRRPNPQISRQARAA